MYIVHHEIEKYAASHSTPESEVLHKLNRETYAKILQARMLSGHLQGNMLTIFSQMLRPRRILEIGTFTGYSAICLAQGLADDGLLYTIDINEELEKIILKYIEEGGLSDKIKLLIGNALEIIPTIPETFDLVFIDADKINYSHYYDLVFDKVRKGGFIIADNVLWYGKVIENKQDKDTKAIQEFNSKVLNDARVSNTILPLRDGLMIVQKLV
jgi:predicted O-methyltransferase YrrM